MDATWYTPQSLHNSSGSESFLAASKTGAYAISKVDGTIDVGDDRLTSVVDGDAIGVEEAGAISVVDEDTIGVDEAGAVSVVDENATPDRLAGARVEGQKTPHLLR